MKHMTLTTSRVTTNKPLENEINYICKDIEANMFANSFNFNERRSDPLQLLMLTSAIAEVLESQPCNPICKSLTIGDFTSKEIEQEELKNEVCQFRVIIVLQQTLSYPT